MESILLLDNIRLSDAARAGRKAAALGALREAGFPVPPGVCLAAQAFFDALEPFRAELDPILERQDFQDPERLIEISAQIQRVLRELVVPQPVWVALEAALAREGWANGPLAVRSSAVCEDGERFSYAGQYVSQIGVIGLDNVRIAICDVWCSYFNPGALAARANPQLGCRGEGMGVLIQPVIEAECAGVCLSVDPYVPSRRLPVASGGGQDLDPAGIHPVSVHNLREGNFNALVVAAWGQGTGVVEGTVPADTYRVRRENLELEERQIVEKIEKIGLDPAGGLVRLPVPQEAQRAACLPEPWLRRVAEFGLAAEQHFGCPQDVEWAIEGNKLWVLQSRPIAGLPPASLTAQQLPPAFSVEWERPEDSRRYWRAVPFGASGPLLPVEWDSTGAAADSRVDGAMLGGDEQTTEVKFFNGRPYFTTVPTPLNPGDRRIRKWRMEDLYRRLLEEGRNTWDYWGPEVIAAARRLAAFDLEGSPDSALADHLENTLGALRRHWAVHMRVNSPAWTPFGELLASLTGLADEALGEAILTLSAGEESALTRLVDGLYELGAAARLSPLLSGFLASPPPDPLKHLSMLEPSLPEGERSVVGAFRLRLEAFLGEWGDRTGKGYGSESTFLMPTWQEDPSLPLRLASLYEDSSVEPPALARRNARQAADARVEEILSRSPEEATKDRFRRLLAQVRRDAVILEDHNHYIDQMTTGQYRAALLACGRRLAKRGLISETLDIFYLRTAEICAVLRGEWGKLPSCPTVADLIAARKEQHARWAALENLPILGVPEAGLPGRPPLAPEKLGGERLESERLDSERLEVELGKVSSGRRITGQPASPGVCQGRARVILNGGALPDLAPGDILVAPNAGPLWTPFFPILGGVVLDGGNLGQHAAAAAREYGIPAVITTRSDLGPATRLIPDGAWVAVDGSRGVVDIIEKT